MEMRSTPLLQMLLDLVRRSEVDLGVVGLEIGSASLMRSFA